jgi:hypothetical protein
MLKTSKAIISDFIVIKFEGEWFDEKNSKCTLLYKNGAKYEGEIKNMKRHGQGEYTYPNVDKLNEAKANNPNMILENMISRDYRSQENGTMMKRSEGQSFTEPGTNTRVSYLKICLMAREC